MTSASCLNKTLEVVEFRLFNLALPYIGYGAEITGVLDVHTCLVMTALQRRYRPDLIDGNIDVQSLEIVTDLANAKKSGSTADMA